MYKQLLIFRYLRNRRIAWVSLIAVMLCTTMVLVVISVMGGWLRMFKESFHGLTGDIIVHGTSMTGFQNYEAMATEIRKLPNVDAVVPTIQSFGLININNKWKQGVSVVGFPIEQIGKVNRFPQSLYLGYQQYVDKADAATSSKDRDAYLAQAAEHVAHPTFEKPLSPEQYRQLVPKAVSDPAKWPGMILGVGVIGIGKQDDGSMMPRELGLYENWVKLDLLAISPDEASPDLASDKSERNYWIADDSHTQVFLNDNSNVYVPFDILQRDLRMNAREGTDAQTGKPITIPARTQDLQIAVKPGVPLNAVEHDIQMIVDSVQTKADAAALASGGMIDSYPIRVETWEEQQHDFIDAVEHEKVLVTVLFSLISVVAIFLIFCIFYMIVVEKTKDIGIIKSVGATSMGVMGVFLGYGLMIGTLGGGFGLLLGYLIIHNINFLHAEMGKLFGIQIWKAKVYAFDTIPNTMNPREAAIIVAIAIISGVLGALLPAVRAARMNPVDALRFE
jgi:lipoprotein-releasing system permease protein